MPARCDVPVRSDADDRAAQLTGRRVPQALPGLVDSHCHLQHEAFDADRGAVLDRARAAGMVRLLVPGYDRRSSEAALELAVAHPDLLDAAVGIHPHHAAGAAEADWRAVERLAAEAQVVAVGEIGLDFYRNLSAPAAQRDAFERQLALAVSVEKPVLVHDRDAHEEVTATLLATDRPRPVQVRGVLHCFSGDAAMALRLAAAGFLVSFALPLSFRSAQGPRAAARALPSGTFLIETDAPWLAPGAGRRNEPTTALRVAAELAALRGVTVEDIAAQVGRTYRALLAR
ncbi:MAG: TatD family hydrolase [Candidatus Limnocylindria bacterium]